MCGGTGNRAICNQTRCHEHGCQGISCSSTKEQFIATQAAAEKRRVATTGWLESIARDYGQETADKCRAILADADYRKAVTP